MLLKNCPGEIYTPSRICITCVVVFFQDYRKRLPDAPVIEMAVDLVALATAIRESGVGPDLDTQRPPGLCRSDTPDRSAAQQKTS
ncbi:MAG: hypothetical protein KAW12_10880 [Candidatus Aminicenantes bacterium]|nr:hypothetical protein [Candidatus Aminicenantes bacterium]